MDKALPKRNLDPREQRLISLPISLWIELDKEAKRRGEFPATLASKVLSNVITDKLFKAVID